MTDARYIVFETGGTKLVAGLADADGRLITTRILDRQHDDRAEQSLERLIDCGLELRETAQLGGATFRGIGFGYGGGVDRIAQRPLACMHEEGWEDLDALDFLKRAFGLPAVIENDCKLAALA